MKYYVYTHSDMNGNVFYIGKGCNGRAWTDERTKEWKQKIKSLNNQYQIKTIYTELTEEEALDAEALLIELYGMNNLVNKVKPSPKSKSTKFYDLHERAIGIKTLYDILENFDRYYKSKFMKEHIDNLVFIEKMQHEIQKSKRLLNTINKIK